MPISSTKLRLLLPDLRKLNADLRVSQEIRTKIILELASDLDALMDVYRRGGASEEEAAAKARKKLLASPDVLETLIAVHSSRLSSSLIWAAGIARRGIDIFIFSVGVLPLCFAAAYAIVSEPLRWTWPLIVVTALAGVLLTVIAWKASQLGLGRERNPAKLRRGMTTIGLIGVLGPLIGSTGFMIELSFATRPLGGTHGPEQMLQLAEIVRDGAMPFAMGLLLSIAALALWIVLASRIDHVEREEISLLLFG